MNYSDALNAMKQGSAVRRAGWGTYPHTKANADSQMSIMSVTVDEQTIQMMLIRLPDGTIAPFGGSQHDILSDDWEIINDAS